MSGITFRGKHSGRDFGLAVRTVSRPIIAPVRTSFETVPGRDGSIDYSELYGRVYYDDKLTEIEISVVAKDIVKLHQKITKTVEWIAGGYGDLLFDDMPNIVWRAFPVSVNDIAPELQRVGKTVIQFRCKPFNRLLWSSKGLEIDSDIPIDSDVPIDFGDDSEYALSNGTNTIVYQNISTVPVSPVFCVTGNISSLVIECGGKTLSYRGGFTSLSIDCDRWETLDGDTDVSYNTTGEYPELLPGENTMTVITDGAGQLIIDFYPQYLYGDDGFA